MMRQPIDRQHKRKPKQNNIKPYTREQTTTTTQATSALYRCIDTYIHRHTNTNTTRNKLRLHTSIHTTPPPAPPHKHENAPQSRATPSVYKYISTYTKASTRHPHANSRQHAQTNANHINSDTTRHERANRHTISRQHGKHL